MYSKTFNSPVSPKKLQCHSKSFPHTNGLSYERLDEIIYLFNFMIFFEKLKIWILFFEYEIWNY